MLGPTDEWFAHARYSAMRQEAERRRMIRQALLARQSAQPLYSPALVWLGRHLNAWGQRLLTRYSPPEPISDCALSS